MNVIKKLIFCLLLLMTTVATASTLHVIMVCDTQAKNIQGGVAINMQSMQKEMADIAYYTDMQLNMKIFYDLEANHNFVDYINKLNVNSDDVVIFYWSGHGYRTESKNNPWPNFAFANDWTGIDQLELTLLIEKKSPSLTISITDTCNSILSEKHAPPLMHMKSLELSPMDLKELKRENYTKLFCNTKGTIITAASIPGQYSYANNSLFGGLWTYSLLNGLQSEVISSKEASWDHVFEVAELKLSFFSVVQTPMHDHW
ncbi:MAG: caspase family protein [Chlamydiota bacterium]|nr:caspase family protein [Chlamydiota bacterium]